MPNLDLMRALAVSAVMAFHFLTAKFRFPSIGWAGVWLFFVLSGFLITRNLIASSHSDGLGAYMKSFYRRRALRIFPLYFAYLLGASVLVWMIGARIHPGAEWAWLVTFTENFYNWHADGSSPLFDHLWSLSAEEQFYLVFPLVIYFLPAGRRNYVLSSALLVTPLLRGLGAATLAASGYSERYVENFSHVFPFMQWDAFIAGALLAVNETRILRVPASTVRLASVVTLGASIAVMAALRVALVPDASSLKNAMFMRWVAHDAYQEIWVYSLLILCGASLLVFFHRLPASHAWPIRAANYIGRISFGMYVFHMPISGVLLHLTQGWETGPFLLAFGALYLATFLMAHLSYQYWEAPLLKLKDGFPRIRLPSRDRPYAAS